MENIFKHKVVIYQDETKDVPRENFKGHVLFFVPTILTIDNSTPLLGSYQNSYSSRELLFKQINKCREDFNCFGKFHFSPISGKSWNKYDHAYRTVLDLSVDSLRQKSSVYFNYPLKCKIAVLFYPKGADWKLYSGGSKNENKLRHDETLFRILLKGAAHYLYDQDNQLEVLRIYSDGVSAFRSFDVKRVIHQLFVDNKFGRTPLRDYVTFSPDISINHLPSDHRQYDYFSDDYINANFLQIADLFLGSIIRSCYSGESVNKRIPNIGEFCKKKDIIAYPVREMLEKKKRGKGFIKSGHYKSFVISEVEFKDNQIVFHELEPKQFLFTNKNDYQISFKFEEIEA